MFAPKIRTWVGLALLIAAAPLLAGCYTTRGAGQDISAAGKGISHAAGSDTHYSP